jgi:hypothetical protein
VRGIFCIDPGRSTGLAWAIVNETSPTVADAMCNRIDSGSATVTGDVMEQAKEILRHWQSFRYHCVRHRLLDKTWVELIGENYIIRVGHKPEEAPISIRVLYAFEGYRHGKFECFRREKHIAPLILQLPSDAMKHNNQKRLRSWDAWIIGREHERQAFCHMGQRLLVLTDKKRVTHGRS